MNSWSFLSRRAAALETCVLSCASLPWIQKQNWRDPPISLRWRRPENPVETLYSTYTYTYTHHATALVPPPDFLVWLLSGYLIVVRLNIFLRTGVQRAREQNLAAVCLILLSLPWKPTYFMSFVRGGKVCEEEEAPDNSKPTHKIALPGQEYFRRMKEKKENGLNPETNDCHYTWPHYLK